MEFSLVVVWVRSKNVCMERKLRRTTEVKKKNPDVFAQNSVLKTDVREFLCPCLELELM
jgi:hypothetical protein